MVIEYVTPDGVYGQRPIRLRPPHRNGVLAILRQDFQYFDRTAPGVLQERLNRDAAELGQDLIRFPQRLIHRLADGRQRVLLVPPDADAPLLRVHAPAAR